MIEHKDRGTDLLPGKSRNYEKELGFIMDALTESAAEISDEGILAVTMDVEKDLGMEAERVRDMLLREVATFKTSTLGPQSREEALTRGRTTFFLTAEARHLIRAIAREMGMTQAAALEILLRKEAFEVGIEMWSPEVKVIGKGAIPT